MRRIFSWVGVAGVCLWVVASCSNQPNAKTTYPTLKSARAISTHYVVVEFEEPAGEIATDPSKYLIVDPQMQPLSVEAATLSENGLEATLTTAAQSDVDYQIAMATVEELLSVGREVPIGAMGFAGTSQREPFLESAVSLSSTQILLTFSQQMDRASAETVAFYEVADPDGNTDIDIRVTGASLQADFITVILTTTPQQNLEYQIRATNIRRRYSCEDGGRVFLDSAAQVATCAANVRPRESNGLLTNFVLTSRTQVDRNASADPNATGIGGSVGIDANGAGVRRPLCTGGTTGIDGANGSDPDEELIFTADRAELAENIVLGIRSMDFLVDMPVLFLSSDTSPGFDHVVNTPAIRAAFSTGVSAGDVVFANIPSLPAGLRIDTIKYRETNGETWVHSICGLAINRRLIDPTRNAARFFGIPPEDNAGPRVVRVVSTSDTELIVYFSEPLNSEAANPANFTITPDLTVIDARLSVFDTQVILTTSPQHVDVEYTVTVANVQDKAGNVIDPTASTSTFTFAGGPAGLGADALPRVVGAASTGNTGVIVTFSKPMGPSAENPSNYVIVQENVNAEVGALVVLSAAFLSDQQNAVQLTTISQNEVTYLLRAVNVRDLSGNQLAPPQLLVDPATAEFPGTPFSCGGEVCEGGFNAGNACDPNQADSDADCKDGIDDGVCSRPTCSPPDIDGDGLLDHVELRGYVVTVELTNGERVQYEVTSDMRNRDTDGDLLTDAEERRIGCDPRKLDTDDDQITDWEEYNFVYSNTNDQDSDNDTIDDFLEVNFFKTNANLADSDGDGFSDSDELYVMNRDPRIADLPSPGIGVDSLNLLLEESFSFTNQAGETEETSSSTKTNVSSSSTQKVSTTFGAQLGFSVNGKFKGGTEGLTDPTLIPEPIALAEVEVGLNFGLSFQVNRESSQTMTESFEASLSKGRTVTNSLSSTRNVAGGRVDALVRLNNLSDVAFSLRNLEITVSAPDPVNRTRFIPVATLIPNRELVTGNSAVFNLGVFNRDLGPILFSSRDVFPTLVEDLLRDPRGLLFEIANFDITDEFGRNFAFASQMARDRTVGLSIDFGDGKPEQFLVAAAPVRFAGSTCDPVASPGCDIVGGLAGFADAGVPPFGGLGKPPGLPLEYILEEVLQLRRSRPVVTAVWMARPMVLPETSETGLCVGGTNDGGECDPSLGNADCDGGICNNLVAPDGILVGANGVSDSIAQGDDVQQIPFGIDGLPPEAVVISAGEDGVLDSGVRGDDIPAVVTGYATTPTCGPDTPSSIRPGPNGIVDTLRDPFSDDVQVVLPGIEADLTMDVILHGSNGFIDTAAAGDDVFVGPGVPCSLDSDCPGGGACDGQEALFRFKHRERGQFGRAWAVLLTDSSQLGVDFRKITVRPGNHVSLAFIQDLDRDGLISAVEFVFGSSDTRQDTDGDHLDDFSEIRVGWEVGVEGSPLRQVFPDPRFPDSDGDGLSDLEEQDIRRVQCECDGGDNAGQSCTNVLAEECPGASCVNVADRDANGNPTACSRLISANRLDPRRRDTDDDLVSDADEVLGWLTQAAILDPVNVVVAGPNRTAESLACPDHNCLGGANDGGPCRFDRDCPTLRRCERGLNEDRPCTNDIDCQGPTPATSGLCEEDPDPTAVGVCRRTPPCDDVQVIASGTFAGNKNAVVVAPGPNGRLESLVSGDDVVVGSAVSPGDRRGSTTALGDDQQIRLAGECLRDDDLDGLCDGVCEDDLGVVCELDSDCATRCVSAPLERVIIRPGVNGIVDTLPNNSNPLGDDVLARGQFLQTTYPLSADTDRDQISEGFERILGSDPRNAVDGGLLVDKDGDGLTDGQEEFVGWIVRATTPGGVVVRRVFSNSNAPDTDLDFLPDFIEHALGTDPTSQDTDGDGLTDFDELSSAQLTDFERFNDFFPGFVLDASMSMAYGTDPLSIDTDGDTLTDDFELRVGWDVTVPTERGQEVRHVLTNPANPDTDFDGLNDNLERTHTVGGLAAPPSDPTDFDSDDDGRTDGNECPTASCQTDPLVPDKRVTIRYVQMTLERGSADGALDLVDISYALGATRSDQPFLPSQQRFVSSDVDDCPGDFFAMCNPPQCQLKEGKEIVFNRSAEVVGDTLQNERVFALKPGQGLLLNGVIDQWEGCPFNTLHVKGRCTDDATSEEFLGCCDTDNSTDCSVGQTCLLSSFEPRVCQGCGVVGVNGRSCVGDGDCIVALGPLTCGRCLGLPCTGDVGDACTFNPAEGTFSLECRPSTTTGPTGHLTYLKSLSYETLQDGFSTDIVTLNDQGAGEGFGVTLTVEIIVE